MEQVKQQEKLPLPQGSWINSARNYYVQGNILFAELKRIDQQYQKTSVQFCAGQNFMNNNGRFEMEMSKDEFDQAKNQMPKGSWINSARNFMMDGDMLISELRTRNGVWRTDRIKIQMNKKYELSNEDGHFRLRYY